MNKLGEKSLKTLEYYEILERLAAQAASEAAKEKCRALRPLDDREQAELWMRQTTDAKDRMVRQGSPSFGGIREVGAILIRADRGGTLNPRELLSVASLLQTARRALAYEAESEEKSALSPIFGLLSGNRSLEEAITTAIVSEEEIADGASPELLSIRRELRRISGRVRETLNRMISGERSKYLQETIITQRNGRFVVPVKAEHRGDVPGLVHDTSSTGATVFVEPQQVVEINNQIKVLEGREEAEIERILKALEDAETYGIILRAKGYVANAEGEKWIHFDYVPGEPDIRDGGAMVTGRICVIGSKLNEEAVAKLFGVEKQ